MLPPFVNVLRRMKITIFRDYSTIYIKSQIKKRSLAQCQRPQNTYTAITSVEFYGDLLLSASLISIPAPMMESVGRIINSDSAAIFSMVWSRAAGSPG